MADPCIPSSPRVRPVAAADRVWVAEFLRQNWSATRIAAHQELIDAAVLPGLVAKNGSGLATYRLLGRDAELVTLNATPAGTGTGTELVEALVARLHTDGCERLWVTTTNDKLSALQFYMRRGFRLIQVRCGAADAARRLKPSIPVVGEHGIPIQDELDLCRVLDRRAPVQDVPPPPPWSRSVV